MEDVKKIPTDQLVEELVGRGCLKINTIERELYAPGYRLERLSFGHVQHVKAQIILVFPPYSLE